MDERTQYRIDTCSLPEGGITISWPSLLSPESCDEVYRWLLHVHSKMERTHKDAAIEDAQSIEHREVDLRIALASTLPPE